MENHFHRVQLVGLKYTKNPIGSQGSTSPPTGCWWNLQHYPDQRCRVGCGSKL